MLRLNGTRYGVRKVILLVLLGLFLWIPGGLVEGAPSSGMIDRSRDAFGAVQPATPTIEPEPKPASLSYTIETTVEEIQGELIRIISPYLKKDHTLIYVLMGSMIVLLYRLGTRRQKN